MCVYCCNKTLKITQFIKNNVKIKIEYLFNDKLLSFLKEFSHFAGFMVC